MTVEREPTRSRTADDLEEIFETAADLGTEQDDPDFEIGELQEALVLAWAHMGPAQRLAVKEAYFARVADLEQVIPGGEDEADDRPPPDSAAGEEFLTWCCELDLHDTCRGPCGCDCHEGEPS